jgi:hypothetical protein
LFAAMIILFFVFIAASIRYGIMIASDLKVYYHHDILFAGWAFCFLILWSGTAWMIAKRFSSSPMVRFLVWIGKNVTAFYVIQWIIIGNIATAIYKTQEWPCLILWFAGITGMTVFLVWVWNRIQQQYRKDKVF